MNVMEIKIVWCFFWPPHGWGSIYFAVRVISAPKAASSHQITSTARRRKKSRTNIYLHQPAFLIKIHLRAETSNSNDMAETYTSICALGNLHRLSWTLLKYLRKCWWQDNWGLQLLNPSHQSRWNRTDNSRSEILAMARKVLQTVPDSPYAVLAWGFSHFHAFFFPIFVRCPEDNTWE